MIEIKKSSIHGRGAFFTSDIKIRQLFACDVIILDKSYIIPTYIVEYTFPWKGKKESCICAGFGSFLNHSDIPNLKIYSIDKENFTMTFISLKNVQVGEELFIFYSEFMSNELKNNAK